MGAILGQSGLMFGATFVLGDGFSKNAARADASISKLAANTTRASNIMASGLRKIKIGFRGLVFSAALAAPLFLGAKAAITYESAFAGVRKTVEASEAEFGRLSDNILGLSTTIPVAATNLAGIGEMAGQLGVKGVENLTKFIDTTARIAVTTNLTEDSAATSFARISNIMQEPISQVDRMAASVVDLGNNFATTEQEIVQFATRIAGAGRIAGFSSADLFALGAGFSSVGVQAEVGGTAVQKVLISMNTALATNNEKLGLFAAASGKTIAQFKELSPVERFVSFIEGLKNQGDKAVLTLDALGLRNQRLIRVFLSMANAGDLLRGAVDRSSMAFEENTALIVESEKRFATTASQLQVTKNQFVDLGITIGNALLPGIRVMNKLLQKTIGFFKAITASPFGKFMVIAVGAIAVLIGTVSALIIILGGLQWALGRVAMGFNIVSIAGLRAGKVIRFVGRSAKLALGWIGLALIAVELFSSNLSASTVDTEQNTVAMSQMTGKYEDFAQKALNPLPDMWRAAEDAAFKYKWSVDQANISMQDFFSNTTLHQFDTVNKGLTMIQETWDGTTFTLTKTLKDELQRLGLLQHTISQGVLGFKFGARSPRVFGGVGRFFDPSKLPSTKGIGFNIPKHFRTPSGISDKITAPSGESLLDILNRSDSIKVSKTPIKTPLPPISELIQSKGGGDILKQQEVSRGDVGMRIQQPVNVQLNLDGRTIAEETFNIEIDENNRE